MISVAFKVTLSHVVVKIFVLFSDIQPRCCLLARIISSNSSLGWGQTLFRTQQRRRTSYLRVVIHAIDSNACRNQRGSTLLPVHGIWERHQTVSIWSGRGYRTKCGGIWGPFCSGVELLKKTAHLLYIIAVPKYNNDT